MCLGDGEVVYDFITAREDIIAITTFLEYKTVMKKAMSVIKEAHNAEKKRRRNSQ